MSTYVYRLVISRPSYWTQDSGGGAQVIPPKEIRQAYSARDAVTQAEGMGGEPTCTRVRIERSRHGKQPWKVYRTYQVAEDGVRRVTRTKLTIAA